MRRIVLGLILLSAILASARAFGQARGSDRLETYTIRPGDTLEVIAETHLGDRARWPELQRLNPEVKDPYKLRIGSTIKVPIPDTTGTALVIQVARKVEKKPQPEPWVAASVGDKLQQSHGIRTGERSSAELKFRDGANMVLTENSLVFLQKLDRPILGPKKDVIEIIDGQADLEAKKSPTRKGAGNIEVIMGSATVRAAEPKAGANRLRSRTTADKKAQVMVYGGAGVVESAGVKVPVSTGMGTTVEQGKAPEKPAKLLPAPSTIVPAGGAKVAGPVLLRWKPVPNATAYTAEICGDAACSKLVARASGLTATEWTAPDDAFAGAYFWRVTASGTNGLDGFPSASVPFTLSLTARGRVVEDRAADGSADGDPAVTSARGVLYADGGDGKPDGADDRKIAETKTDSAGNFAFTDFANGGATRYWIVVPADSVRLAGADVVVVPAQTICMAVAQRSTPSESDAPCYKAGRAGSTDASGEFASAEQVGAFDTRQPGSQPRVFGYSGDVVSNLNDAGPGSLRQFLLNAASIPGEHHMRLALPDSEARATLKLASPLPEAGAGIVIDGAALPSGGATRNLAIDGSALGAQPAITLAGGATLKSVSVSGAGVGVSLRRAENVVESSQFIGNGIGVELAESARNNDIKGCTFSGNVKAGIADSVRPQTMPEPRGNRFARNTYVTSGGPAIYMPSWGDMARPELARRPCVAGWPVTVPPVITVAETSATGGVVVKGASCAGATIEVYGYAAETRTFAFAGEATAGADGRFTVSLPAGSGTMFAALATTAAGTSSPSAVIEPKR